MSKLLEIRHLTTAYGNYAAVHDISLEVETGKIVMLVGESGSGKSTILKSVLGLLGANGIIETGEILFQGNVLPIQEPAQMRRFLGRDIAVILQNPENYLDPLMSIGAHYYEIMSSHGRVSKKEAKKIAAESLGYLGFQKPVSVLRKKPFELSGGMCQRAAIAIAMANHPALLLGDEPTSALDVVLQEEVMGHLAALREQYQTTLFFVTHNISLVLRYADAVGVMKNGFLVEWGTKAEILTDARHFYTRMLLASVPSLNGELLPAAEQKPQGFGNLEGSSRYQISDTHWYLRGGEGI